MDRCDCHDCIEYAIPCVVVYALADAEVMFSWLLLGLWRHIGLHGEGFLMLWSQPGPVGDGATWSFPVWQRL